MHVKQAVTRRGFVGGAAAALGALGLRPGPLWGGEDAPFTGVLPRQSMDYDALAKLANNENPWGPSESALTAMNAAWKYSMRYGYPDGDIQEKIAAYHGVKPQNILMGAGSGEILRVVGLTYNTPGKKIVGVEPTYMTVFSHASGLKADGIMRPLVEGYRQDIDDMIKVTKRNYRDVSFVYLCNPNNPTGVVVTAAETKQLLDGVPEDMPVLIDEAYHHFVRDPNYEESIKYVKEGRNVIVARTFSKIYGFAGLRLGYAVAPEHIIQRMRDYSTGTINALVKHGAVAALEDTPEERRVRDETIRLRERTATQLRDLGHEVIPSETNFFMVGLRRQVQPVIQEFRQRGVLVGRPFPPMTEHLRVSVGLEDEMDRFMVAWKEIFTGSATSSGG